MVIPYNSVPTIYKNLLIVGANVPERQGSGQPGIHAPFDVITGKKVWEFHSVPNPANWATTRGGRELEGSDRHE